MSPRTLLSIGLILFAAGCGSSDGMITGAVTVNSQPLQRGYITFYPTEGTANTCGAEVIDGVYELKDVPPGPRKAVVTVPPKVDVVQHADKPATLKVVPASPSISMQTKGNQQVVEIRAGKQTLDLDLKPPPTDSRR